MTVDIKQEDTQVSLANLDMAQRFTEEKVHNQILVSFNGGFDEAVSK